MTNKIVDIADEIYRELGEPTDVSISSIAFWLRSNLGKLNILIAKDFYIDEITLEVAGKDYAFTLLEKAIFKKLYNLHYYDRQIINLIGKARAVNLVSTDATTSGTTNSATNSIEIQEDGFTYKKDNSISTKTANETIKANTQFVRQLGLNFTDLKRVENEELKHLLLKYSTSTAMPIQVTGDDIIAELNRTYNYSNTPRDLNTL
jgi:hypothetical protein